MALIILQISEFYSCHLSEEYREVFHMVAGRLLPDDLNQSQIPWFEVGIRCVYTVPVLNTYSLPLNFVWQNRASGSRRQDGILTLFDEMTKGGEC